jgi:D-3-phosphoglycerate dehydrogenase
VGVYGVKLEIEFAAHMLVMQNDDLPGVIGRVGTMLGEEQVNIANMNVSRGVSGNGAVMVLSLDHPPQPVALERLRRLDGIHSVRLVDVGA